MMQLLVMRIESFERIRTWCESGELLPSTRDTQDGFIHLSPIEGVEETATRYFLPEDRVAAVEVAAEPLGSALVFEDVVGREAPMPHLYAPAIPWSAVTAIHDLNFDAVGVRIGQRHTPQTFFSMSPLKPSN